jgi:signal transduction histidine kinase
MIAVGRERFEAYTAEEAEVIFTFANQAAIAIQNARLYDQVTRFNQQLEQRVKDRTVELERAYDRLTKMDHNKTDFISIAAHEMRTPLTVLLGYTSLLKADAGIQADPQLVEVLDGILNGASRMHEVINQMLEAARVDSQQLDMHLRQMNLSLVIQRVRGDFRMAVAERSLTLEIKDLNQLPTIQADVELLYKVFYNVVINAIKYTPDGGRIAISHNLRREGTATWVDVMVQDTGVGIAPEYHELIFEKFYQMGEVAFHSSGKTKFKGGGAGLGLAIARGIVQAHHGRIWVESPGHDEKQCPGSCFHILLPVAVSKALPLAEPE